MYYMVSIKPFLSPVNRTLIIQAKNKGIITNHFKNTHLINYCFECNENEIKKVDLILKEK